MQKPKDYVPDSTVITYQYNKGGKTIEFDQSHFPDDFDSTYIFVSRYDKLIRKGTGGAKITDFNLTTLSGNDTTQAMLAMPKYVMIMGNSSHTNFNVWHSNLLKVRDYCTANNISLFYITPQSGEETSILTKENITTLKCDATIIKTAARVNTTYYLMNKATVVNKFSDRSIFKIMDALAQLKAL
jgi:hypothetical protein